MKKLYFFLIALIFLYVELQAQIIRYSSNDNSGCSGVITTPGFVTGTGICRGSGVIRETDNGRYKSNRWTENTNLNTSENDYYEWTVQATSGRMLDLSNVRIGYGRDDGAFTTDGPQRFRLQVDYGSGVYTSIQYDVGTTNSGVLDISLTPIPVTANEITFRLYGYFSGSTSGSFWLNNIASPNVGIMVFGSVLTPNLTVSPTSVSGLDYFENYGPSDTDTFSVSGTNLSDSVTITAPSDFEISTSATTGFGSSITLNPNSFGTLVNTNIHVRLASNLNSNNYLGNLSVNSTGATTRNISLNGIVSSISPCGDLFISEYIEGSSNNKYLEIYNPTSSTISLSGYDVQIFSNGNTTGSTIALSGTIDSYDVFVMENISESLGVDADLSTGSLNFNGDDAVALRNSGTIIDVIGQIGNDPGSQWFGSSCGTENNTLIRNNAVQNGDPNGNNTFDFTNEWTCFSQDDISNLGSHTSDCFVPCTPIHSISSFSPSSGPENTQITILGSGFTGSSIVSIGGQNTTIVSQSTTQLSVIFPNGATSGVISITESGCDTSAATEFTILSSNFDNCDGVVNPTELFISQLTDATSGSLSYIELYNGTGSTVSLDDYTLQIRYNAGGSVATIPLSGTLADGDTHVASTNIIPACATVVGADGSLSDQTSGISGINAGNNDSDCISLYKNYTSSASPGTLIDVWGDCGNNNWMDTLGIGDEGFNFSRLTNSSPPNTTFNIGDWDIVDWEDNSCADDEYSDIGNYTTANPPSISSIAKTDSNCGALAQITVTASEGFDGVGDTKELTYQWYSIAPGDSNWSLLSDDAIYSNTSTNVLDISNTLNLDGYQYYCEVRENDATCFVASEATTLSVATATWDGTDWIWNDNTPINTEPTLGTNVVITGDFSGGNISACNLLVNNGSILTVSNGSFVEVTNDVTVNNARITTQTSGSFVQRGNGTIAGNFILNTNGDANVNKTTAVLNNTYDYTYWSTPVENITVEQGLTDANINRTYTFNANNFLDTDGDGVDDNGDAWTLAARTDTMIPSQGFASMHDAFGMGTGVAYSYNFEGAYNTGDIIFSVPYDTNNNDEHWNLIGNPYPSAIDANAFFTQNSGVLDGVLYMWSHVSPPDADNNGNEVLNFNQSDYITVNTMSTAGNGTTFPPESRVPSGQSFFISSNASGSGLFTNSMRVSGNNVNNEFFRTANTSNQNTSDNIERLWLNLSSDVGIYSQISIGYADFATDEYDGNSIDTERNYAGNAGFLYSLDNQGEGFYVIQGKALNSLNEDEVIKIGFGALISTNETYTIDAIKWEGNFLSSNPIYLRDSLLNTIHDLSSSSYTFNSDGGIFDQRFEIVFKQNALSTNEIELDSNKLTIVELQDDNVEFSTNSNHSISSIAVYDLQGRLIYNFEGNSPEEIFNLSSLSSQIYIAKINLSNGIVISRKAFKK